MPRLPKPGGDRGNWGSILNSYLGVEHNSDGSLKRSSDITDAQVKANQAIRTLNGKTPTNGSLTLTPEDLGALAESDLDPAVAAAIEDRYAGAAVNAFGADPTGAAASDEAFLAALNSLPTTVVDNGTAQKTYHVGRLLLGHGRYRLDGGVLGNLGPWVDVLGPGHNSCTLDYRGSGSCLRAWNEVDPRYPSNTFDVMFDQDDPHGIGARYNGFLIDGANAGAGAVGLHVGDFEGGNLGPELFIRNFDGAGSTGLYFDNQISWAENWRGSASLYNCNTHVKFTRSSMSYNHLDFKIYARHNQDGVVLGEGAAYYHGTLKVTANFEVAPTGTPNNAAYLTIGTGVDDPGVPSTTGTWLKNCHVVIQGENVRTEVSTQGAAVPAGSPMTIRFGDMTKDKLDGCTGLLSFGGQLWKPSNWVASLDNHVAFSGIISGDTVLNPNAISMTNPFPIRAPIAPVSTVIPSLRQGAIYSSTIDLRSGDFFDFGQLAADLTPIFGNGAVNNPRRIVIRVQQGSTFRVINWPSNPSNPSLGSPHVMWEGGVPPMLSRVNAAVDFFELSTINGTTWLGRQRPGFSTAATLPRGTYRNRGGSTTAATTVNVAPNATVPVGSALFAFVASTSTAAVATPAITDAQGNTWTLDAGPIGAAGARVWVYRTVVTTAITGNVTLTWSGGTTNSYLTLLEVTGLGSAPKIDRSTVIDQAAASTSLAIAPDQPTQRVAEIAIAWVASDGGNTQWTITGSTPPPLGAWTQSTSGAPNEQGQVAWLSLPAAGNQSEIKFTPAASRRMTAILLTYSA